MKTLPPRLLQSRPLRWIAAVLLLVGVLGYLVLPPFAKYLMTRQLSEKLHRDIQVREIVIHPYALSAYVRGFQMKECDGSAVAASFEQLYVNLEAVSLLRGNLVLREIHVDAPYVRLVRNTRNSYNFTDLIEEFLDKPDTEPPSRFALYNIELHGGKIDFEDRPLKQRHQVSGLRIAVPFISNLPSYTDVYVQPLFEAKIDGRHVSLAGKTRPFGDKIEATLELDTDDLDLTKYQEYLPQHLPFRLSSGRLDTRLTAAFSQEKGKSPHLQVNGDIALKQAAVADTKGKPMFSLAGLDIHIASSKLFGSPLSAEGKLKATGLAVHSYTPLANLEIGGGSLNAASRFTFSLDNGKPGLVLDKLTAELSALGLRRPGDKQPFFTLSSATLSNARFDLAKRRLEIGEFATRNGKLNVRRERNGTIDLAKLGDAPPAKPAGKRGDTPWHFSLNKLTVSDYAIRFEDDTPIRPVVLASDPISLSAENLSTAKDNKANLSLHAALGKNGAIDAAGTLALATLQASLKLDIQNIDLVPLQPYFTRKLNVRISRGAVSTKGALDIALPGKTDGPPKTAFRGEANLADFHVLDKADSADLLKWKSLYFGDIQAGTAPLNLAIGQIALSDFYTRLIIDAGGKLNLQRIVRAPAEQGAGAAPPSPAEPAPTVKIGKVTLQNGNIDFSDRYVKPNYSANLTDIGGKVAGLSSEPGTSADVDLRGRLDGAAPLEIGGKINPLTKDLFADIKASVKGVELTPFTPYSGKYTGYAIDKGKLSLDVRYRIENRKLEAENQLFLDQLTFGERIESPDATQLPVLLAMALLKNRNGEIDINLPISGSLDDPEFSMGGLIVKVIVNLFVKAVTSPFALIGSLFGGGEDLGYLEFASGRHTIDAAGENKLKTLAKALNERPALEMEITGRIDPANDAEGLKHALLEQKVKAQKLAALVKQGISAGSLDEIAVKPGEYPALLKAAYQKEKFPKPRNMLWLAKDLPVPDMEKLMLSHTAVADDDLRGLANRRAQAIRDWLVAKGGIAPDRIFLLAPKLGPASSAEKKDGKIKDSRADFSLK